MAAVRRTGIPVKSTMQMTALTAILSLGMNVNAPAALAQQQSDQQQQTQQKQQPAPIPDAPAPQPQTQTTPPPITDAASGPIKPGGGAGTETPANGSSSSGDAQGPTPQQPAPQQPAVPLTSQQLPPEKLSPEEIGHVLRLNVTYVEVPVTIKDSKGNEVGGLDWRDFSVYENSSYEPLKVFNVDAYPLSVAFVVDQSLPRDVMAEVNNSLGAIQGALTAYDEIAVFTYGNGAHNQSGGFTGAQTARVPFILANTKSAGTEQLNPVNDGPFGSCNVQVNGNCADPNLQAGKSAGSGYFMTIPKEIHTLNDAILAAARELSTRPKGRRRIIYVISDGKEAGSKAKYNDVLKYLQTNHILVYGTLLGEAARWGEGRLSRVHIPFTGVYDNRLYSYVLATGGTLDSEHGVNNIEKSYIDLAREARTRYTLVYASHEPLIDGKFRKIDVRVNRPNLEVVAPLGYWPSSSDDDTKY
jgi:VWFA-related protein